MILAGTSAWVEYDRGTGSSVDDRVAELIADGGPLVVTEPMMMEVLAGARDEVRQQDLRRLLLGMGWLTFDATTDFDAATRIYRRCRASGVTPRGMIDCMIAAVAWREGAALLCRDADLNRVAGIIGIDRPLRKLDLAAALAHAHPSSFCINDEERSWRNLWDRMQQGAAGESLFYPEPGSRDDSRYEPRRCDRVRWHGGRQDANVLRAI